VGVQIGIGAARDPQRPGDHHVDGWWIQCGFLHASRAWCRLRVIRWSGTWPCWVRRDGVGTAHRCLTRSDPQLGVEPRARTAKDWPRGFWGTCWHVRSATSRRPKRLAPSRSLVELHPRGPRLRRLKPSVSDLELRMARQVDTKEVLVAQLQTDGAQNSLRSLAESEGERSAPCAESKVYHAPPRHDPVMERGSDRLVQPL